MACHIGPQRVTHKEKQREKECCCRLYTFCDILPYPPMHLLLSFPLVWMVSKWMQLLKITHLNWLYSQSMHSMPFPLQAVVLPINAPFPKSYLMLDVNSTPELPARSHPRSTANFIYPLSTVFFSILDVCFIHYFLPSPPPDLMNPLAINNLSGLS